MMSKQTIKIGYGYDVHVYAEGRPLILGGVTIDHTKGLLGHSDADVLIHAIIDALLGALALGDIGSWFPDSDPRYKNISSELLLKEVIENAIKPHWNIGNIDSTIIAERPKLRNSIDSIRENLARILEIPLDCVSLKATTSEKMGFVGREEGMACHAVVLLEKSFN